MHYAHYITIDYIKVLLYYQYELTMINGYYKLIEVYHRFRLIQHYLQRTNVMIYYHLK